MYLDPHSKAHYCPQVLSQSVSNVYDNDDDSDDIIDRFLKCGFRKWV